MLKTQHYIVISYADRYGHSVPVSKGYLYLNKATPLLTNKQSAMFMYTEILP